MDIKLERKKLEIRALVEQAQRRVDTYTQALENAEQVLAERQAELAVLEEN